MIYKYKISNEVMNLIKKIPIVQIRIISWTMGFFLSSSQIVGKATFSSYSPKNKKTL